MIVERFGTMADGRPVHRISISAGPMSARILTYGSVLQDLRLRGHTPALVLGFDSFDDYLSHSPYFGATAGRCANRIRDGHLALAGKTYQLDRNFLDRHHLHGGAGGMANRLWTLEAAGKDFVTLSIRLDDGDMGYPGNMSVLVTYRTLPEAVLDIDFSAISDATTLCNLAHHSYFNLDGSASILDHRLTVNAAAFTPVDDALIPTGQVESVHQSALDFRRAKTIRPISETTLLDHNYCLADRRGPIRPVAILASPRAGLRMEVRTTEPGLQVYDGAKIDISRPGLDGMPMAAHAGMALEPQVWPDAVHHAHFPQAVLQAGETYRQHTQYAFARTGK